MYDNPCQRVQFYVTVAEHASLDKSEIGLNFQPRFFIFNSNLKRSVVHVHIYVYSSFTVCWKRDVCRLKNNASVTGQRWSPYIGFVEFTSDVTVWYGTGSRDWNLNDFVGSGSGSVLKKTKNRFSGQYRCTNRFLKLLKLGLKNDDLSIKPWCNY